MYKVYRKFGLGLYLKPYGETDSRLGFVYCYERGSFDLGWDLLLVRE